MGGKRVAGQLSHRTKLLGCAVNRFVANGYEKTALRDIARDAGLSTGAIFSNFGSKEGLFAAAMNRPAPDVKAFLEKVSGCLYYGPPMLEELAKEAAQMRADLYGAPG